MVGPKELVGVGAAHSMSVLANRERQVSRLLESEPLVRKNW